MYLHFDLYIARGYVGRRLYTCKGLKHVSSVYSLYRARVCGRKVVHGQRLRTCILILVFISHEVMREEGCTRPKA